MDYGFIPTVLTPKHKKVEIVKAIAKGITNKQQNGVLIFLSTFYVFYGKIDTVIKNYE